MELTDIAVIAVFVVAYGACSARLSRTVVTPPMVFVAFGIVMGPEALGVLELSIDQEAVRILAEATLVLVLFSDAARIDLRVLRRQAQLPARLLGIGLPLTIAAGGLTSAVLFGGLEIWEAMLVGVILAPTDAALGQVVVVSERIPIRIRQTLNVESGLNDGIALPVITLFLALAAVEEEIQSTSFWVEFVLEQIGYGVLVGVVVGYVGGRVIDLSSRRGWIDGTFQQLSTLAVGVAAYALAVGVDGNGFIAAFVAGITFGSVARATCHGIYDFTEEEGQLLALLTFLVFGATIAGPALGELTWQIAVYAALSLTVVRMLPVAISLLGSRLHRDSVLFVGWFGPRGLASILFGLLVLEEVALAGRNEVFLVVTWTVLVSVYAHGLSALPGVRWYGARYEEMAEEHDEMPEAMEVEAMPTRIGPTRASPPRAP